ncbi:hypothetical protein H5410_008026, partial [Solanum commersonii]
MTLFEHEVFYSREVKILQQRARHSIHHIAYQGLNIKDQRNQQRPSKTIEDNLQQSTSSLENNWRRDFINPRKQPGTSLQLVPVDNRRTFGFIHPKIGHWFVHPKIGHGFVHPKIGYIGQPEASFIILVPVDNRRILDIIYHWDTEDNRRPHLSFKSPKTIGGLIYHFSPRRQPETLLHHLHEPYGYTSTLL